MTPLTTVAIICYNYAHFLPQALESVLNQSRRPHVLVLDDASTDNTTSVVFERLRRGDRFDYVHTGMNRGLARVRNLAATLASTEWIVFLDADDWLDERYIERGEAWLRSHEGIAVLTTDMTIVRGDRQVAFRSRVPAGWTSLLARNTIVQTSFIRREVIAAVGGYDPGLVFEDWDFWVRVLKAGFRIGRLPGSHVFRREHGLNMSKVCDEREAERQFRERHPLPARRRLFQLRART
jgi:glycosyltransferase involved in cell wall biosynthesis